MWLTALNPTFVGHWVQEDNRTSSLRFLWGVDATAQESQFLSNLSNLFFTRGSYQYPLRPQLMQMLENRWSGHYFLFPAYRRDHLWRLIWLDYQRLWLPSLLSGVQNNRRRFCCITIVCTFLFLLYCTVSTQYQLCFSIRHFLTRFCST